MSTFLLILIFRLFTDPIDMTNIGGEYAWAGPFQGDPWGELIVYPDSDSTFAFFLRASNGSDDGDVCVGIAKMIGDNLYASIKSETQNDCKIVFDYQTDYIIVETDSQVNNCESSVISNLNENFMRQSNFYPDYYLIEKDTLYFKDLIDN